MAKGWFAGDRLGKRDDARMLSMLFGGAVGWGFAGTCVWFFPLVMLAGRWVLVGAYR